MDNFTSRLEDLGGGKAILRLSGEIDMAIKAELANGLQNMARGGYESVIIDGTEITFMDSTGFHALVDGKRALHERGISIILVASPQMRRLLELISPEPIFAARVDTIDEAMSLLLGIGEPQSHSDTQEMPRIVPPNRS